MSRSFSFDSKQVPHVKTQHRLIQTAIPAPGTKELYEQIINIESRSMHGQMPIVWDRASGFNVYDIAGNCWIDFTSTIFVTNVGHANPRVKQAIHDCVQQELLHSYNYITKCRIEYLKKLLNFAGDNFEKAFLLSSGTEATECALKLMRLYGIEQGKRRGGIICLNGNWHGRTLGAQLMSSAVEQKKWIGFKDNNIHHLNFPYPWSLNKISGAEFLACELKKLQDSGICLQQDICGVMLETFQGWGAIFYPQDFIEAMREVCDKYGLLLAFDEMQSGFGRTAKNFGYQHYNIAADLICCGKGMGSGIPLSGVIAQAKILDLPDIGSMSSTHSANPLACMVGIATIDELIENNMIVEAARKGKILHAKLGELWQYYSKNIAYVFSKGLLAAVHFKHPATNMPDADFASKVALRCMHKGLLVVHTGRESIKIAPPLSIADSALQEGIMVLSESIQEIIRESTSG